MDSNVSLVITSVQLYGQTEHNRKTLVIEIYYKIFTLIYL